MYVSLLLSADIVEEKNIIHYSTEHIAFFAEYTLSTTIVILI